MIEGTRHDPLLPKLFGLGLPRTGTTSLDRALQQLQIRSAHFVMDLYRDASSPVLDRFQAFGDAPIPLLYPTLDARFPGSRFILTRRRLEPWLSSMRWLFEHGKAKWRWDYATHAYHQEFFGTRRYDRKKLTERYHSYHAEVEAYFRHRPQDLLIIDLDHERDVSRLCRFLGKPEVDVAFPRTNARDAVALHRRLGYRIYERFLTSSAAEQRLERFLHAATLGRFVSLIDPPADAQHEGDAAPSRVR